MAPPDREFPPDPELLSVALEFALGAAEVLVADVVDVEDVNSAGNGSPGDSWNFTSLSASFWASRVKFVWVDNSNHVRTDAASRCGTFFLY
jgi:hypothetical protein